MPGGKQEIHTEEQRLQEREGTQGKKAGLKEHAGQPQQAGKAGQAGQAEQTQEIQCDNPNYKGSGKLRGKTALISGGSGGIGRSVAIFYAREGADICLINLKDHEAAQETKRLVEKEGQRCHLICGDLCDPNFAKKAVQETIQEFGKLDILVNHAGTAQTCHNLEELTEEQFDHTMKNNVYSNFYLTKAALPHLQEGSCIINTTSVTAYRGDRHMLDYATSKGASKAWTFSLANNLAKRGIRVNAVAPGMVSTPMVQGAMDKTAMEKVAQRTLLGRIGQPYEIAPAYVFLASADASYITGQTLHPNGGIITAS